MPFYDKFVNTINKIYGWTGMFLLVVVIVMAIIQVFTRKVLNASMVGTEEVARYAFIWTSFLAASICVTKMTHPSIDILNNVLKGKAKHIHLILINIVMLIFSVILMIYGTKLTEIVAIQLSPTLRLPMSIIYAAAPVGGFGMFVNGISVIINQIKIVRQKSV